MHAERLKDDTVGAGVLITAAVLLLGVLSLAYGHFQQSATAFTAGLAIIVVGVVSGILQVAVLPNWPGDRFSAR